MTIIRNDVGRPWRYEGTQRPIRVGDIAKDRNGALVTIAAACGWPKLVVRPVGSEYSVIRYLSALTHVETPGEPHSFAGSSPRWSRS